MRPIAPYSSYQLVQYVVKPGEGGGGLKDLVNHSNEYGTISGFKEISRLKSIGTKSAYKLNPKTCLMITYYVLLCTQKCIWRCSMQRTRSFYVHNST